MLQHIYPKPDVFYGLSVLLYPLSSWPVTQQDKLRTELQSCSRRLMPTWSMTFHEKASFFCCKLQHYLPKYSAVVGTEQRQNYLTNQITSHWVITDVLSGAQNSACFYWSLVNFGVLVHGCLAIYVFLWSVLGRKYSDNIAEQPGPNFPSSLKLILMLWSLEICTFLHFSFLTNSLPHHVL